MSRVKHFFSTMDIRHDYLAVGFVGMILLAYIWIALLDVNRNLAYIGQMLTYPPTMEIAPADVTVFPPNVYVYPEPEAK